jgi:hypothetical protein
MVLSMSAWRRSSACAHTGCVEVQFKRSVIRVRNSHRPEQTVEFTPDEWSAFLTGALAGEFDSRSEGAARRFT